MGIAYIQLQRIRSDMSPFYLISSLISLKGCVDDGLITRCIVHKRTGISRHMNTIKLRNYCIIIFLSIRINFMKARCAFTSNSTF